MCYYARTDYPCGDWKWGNMMERCPRQHRIGETCGTKLVHENHVSPVNSPCKLCQEIETKQRRLKKTVDNLQWWRLEPDKFTASIEKAVGEAQELQDKIKELNLRRPSVRSNDSTRPPVLPPISTMAPSYQYRSPTQVNRREEPNPYISAPPHGANIAPSSVSPTNGYGNRPPGIAPGPRGIAVATSRYPLQNSPYSAPRRQ